MAVTGPHARGCGAIVLLLPSFLFCLRALSVSSTPLANALSVWRTGLWLILSLMICTASVEKTSTNANVTRAQLPGLTVLRPPRF